MIFVVFGLALLYLFIKVFLQKMFPKQDEEDIEFAASNLFSCLFWLVVLVVCLLILYASIAHTFNF